MWVSIITYEQIVGFWTESTDFEQLHQVKKLTMDISAYLVSCDETDNSFIREKQKPYCYGRVYRLDVSLFD